MSGNLGAEGIKPLIQRGKGLMRFKLLEFVQDILGGGESLMAQDVLCEVNSCKYWGAGNKCNASAIYVVNRMGKQATSSEETDCKTFEPKL